MVNKILKEVMKCKKNKLEIKVNKKYNLNELFNTRFNNVPYFTLVLPNSIYGTNKTRILNKAIEIDRLIINNISNIVFQNVSGIISFYCLDEKNNVLVVRTLDANESLVIKEDILSGTYIYNFVKINESRFIKVVK